MLPGSKPVGGVSAGRLTINSGCLTISTLEQIGAAKPVRDLGRYVHEGSLSDYVSIHNGYGDGMADIVALVDEGGAICGIVHGDIFESHIWNARLLPGEEKHLMPLHELYDIFGDCKPTEDHARRLPVIGIGP